MRAVVGGGVGVGVHGPQQGFGQHPHVAAALRVEHAGRHQRRAGRRQRHQARHVRAVAVADVAGVAAFGGVGIVVDEVAAEQRAARRARQPRGQRGVGEIDAGVEHRHADAVAAAQRVRGRQPQGFGGPLRGVGAGVAAGGPGRAAAAFGGLVLVVRLGVQHPRVGAQRVDDGLRVAPRRHAQLPDRALAEAVDRSETEVGRDGREVAAAQQPHDDLAGQCGVLAGSGGGGRRPGGRRRGGARRCAGTAAATAAGGDGGKRGDGGGEQAQTGSAHGGSSTVGCDPAPSARRGRKYMVPCRTITRCRAR